MKPTISIGLPVYNGDRFLEEALDSVLNQSFQNFELIISDNASTDRTEEICRRYAARDSRIQYHRNDHNLGAAPNFNQVFKMAVGKYFKWMAADDVIEPTFLELCLELLEQNDAAVLAYSKADFVRPNGQHWWSAAISSGLTAIDPSERFRSSISNFWCLEVFGLIRRDVLESTSLIGSYYGSDKVLLAQLCLRGTFGAVNARLFHRRCHSNQSSRLSKSERDQWIDTSSSLGHKVFRSRLSVELAKSVVGSQLDLSNKIACLKILGSRFVGSLPNKIKYYLNQATPSKVS